MVNLTKIRVRFFLCVNCIIPVLTYTTHKLRTQNTLHTRHTHWIPKIHIITYTRHTLLRTQNTLFPCLRTRQTLYVHNTHYVHDRSGSLPHSTGTSLDAMQCPQVLYCTTATVLPCTCITSIAHWIENHLRIANIIYIIYVYNRYSALD